MTNSKKGTGTIPVLSPAQAIEFIKCAIKARLKPVMLHGSPGVGKSQIAEQVAYWYALELASENTVIQKALETYDKITGNQKKRAGMFVKDVRMLMRNPVHFQGLPDVTKKDGYGRTYFTHPADIPTDAEPYTVLNLEELPLAVPSVQALGYQLTLERRIGEAVLPEHIMVMATGNLKGQGPVNQMPMPLADRLLHIEVQPEKDSWIVWAVQNGIHKAVIAYANWSWHQFNVLPGAQVKVGSADIQYPKDAVAFPTNRAWSWQVSDLLHAGIPQDIQTEVIASAVGVPIATAFCGFLRIYQNLPDPRTCLMNPSAARVPDHTQPAARWALAVNLADAVTDTNMSNALQYLERFTDSNGIEQKEFAMFFLKAATARDATLDQNNSVTAFYAENSHLMFS